MIFLLYCLLKDFHLYRIDRGRRQANLQIWLITDMMSKINKLLKEARLQLLKSKGDLVREERRETGHQISSRGA